MLAWGTVTPAAALIQLRIFADLDNDAATGCTILTVNGPWAGAEEVVTTTIDPLPGQVVAVVQQICLSGVLGPPIPSAQFSPPWPVGLGIGTLGSDVVETFVQAGKFGGGTVRLGFTLDDGAGGASTLLTRNGQPGGPPVTVILAPAPIPTLGTWAFVVLVVLVLITGFVFARRRGLRAGAWSALLVLIAGVGLVWAAIVLDGQIGDWAGIPTIATDEVGTSAVKAAFATREGATIFVRADGGFVCAPITVNPVTLPGGIRNIAYAPVTYTQTGGLAPITWSHTGALPAGMSLSAGGVLSGTPTEAGTFPITVKATDVRGCTKLQPASLVIAINAPPTAGAQSVGTTEETPVGITLSATDTDSPGGLTFAIVTGPSHGSLGPLGAPVCGPAGGGSSCTASVTYTPNGNYEGPDSFTFTASDGIVTSAEATVSITVAGVNDPPVVNGATFSLPENSPNGTLVGTPITFADPDAGQTWGFSIVGGNTGGAFAIGASSGQITVASVAAVDFETNPTFTLTVRVTDTGLPVLSGDATVTINLTDVNEAPVVSPATFGLVENSPNGTVVGTVTATDQDPGQTKTFAITAGNTGGAFAIDATSGQITVLNSTALDFETNPTFSLTVQATDNGAPVQSGTATVTVNLTNTNEAPVVNLATFSVPEKSANGTAVGTVTFTDSDVGQTHTFAITSGNTGNAFAIDPSSGQITVDDSIALDFETQPTFNLTVQVTDNGVPVLFGTAPITVNLTDVNETPIVNAATFGVAENSPNGTVVGTVTFDPVDGGQTHTFAITAGNTGGAFAIDPSSGQITVATSSALNFEASLSFSLTVEVTDSGAPPLTGSATITVNLSNVNEAPVAASQLESMGEDTAKEITLSATDPDHLTLTFTIVGTPGHGVLSAVTHDPCTPDGTGGATCTAKVTYTPTGNFDSPPTDSFAFKATDGLLVDSNIATITVTVNASPDAPVANNQSPSTTEDTPLLITLSGVDVDGHNLTFTHGTGPSHGTLDLPYSAPVCQPPDSNGAVTCTATVTYTPSSNYNGPDSFTFTVNNTVTDSAAGTVSITVTATNDPPVAADVPGQTTAEDTLKTVTLTASDIDSLTLTFSVDPPQNGSVSAVTPIGCVPDGNGGATCTASVDYTPALHYNGPDTFTYRANDGTSDSNTATVTLTVTPVNDAPTANAQSVSTVEDTDLPITLTGTDVETANANLTFLVTVDPTHGSLTGTPPNVTYHPASHYVGPDSFQFTVTDRGDPDNCGAVGPACTAPLVSAAATVSITVTCPTITVNGTIPTLILNQAMATATFTQTGGSLPITWSASGLPNGVAINPSSGDVTGTPTQSGPFSATITATDAGGCTGSKIVAFNVSQPPAITSADSTTFAPGKTGQTFTVTTTGIPTNTITRTGTLPSGVTFTDHGDNTATIGGTPAAGTQTASPYSWTITAANGTPPDANQPFTFNVVCPAITVNGTIPALTFNVPMTTATFTQLGGNGTISWSISGQPTGISIGASSGDVTGTPTQTGTFNVAVTATDAGGCTGTKNQSVTVAPVAGNDTYNNLVNNTEAVVTLGTTPSPSTPFVPLSGFVTANDTPAGNVTVTSSNPIATTQGGSVTIAADGSFKYTPPVTVTALASDSFTYTISSNTGGTATPTTANGTVTLNLAGRVWYVNPNAGVNGNGQSQSPWNSTANIKQQPTVGGANTGDRIFAYNGPTGNLTANIPLLANQILHGEGVALVVNSVTLRSAGTAPSLTASAANVVSVNSGNTITGVTLTNSTNALVSGAPAGLTLNTVTMTPTGSAHGLDITGGSGTVALTNVTMTGTGSGDVVKINTGTQAWTFTNSPITQTAGRALNVQNKTGGGMTFDATSTVTVSAGTTNGAIALLNNSGASNTFAFSKIALTTSGPAGALLLDTTGTVNNSDTTSTISATDTNAGPGTIAIDADSTTLGLTFQNVSVTGTNANVLAGIQLATVGGSLTVNGGSISTDSGKAASINGGAASFTYAGSISNSGPSSGISVINKTGGTVIFSNATKTLNTGPNAAVAFTGNNASTTMNFTGGGLGITTSSGIGFNATAGGTVNVTGAGNIITSVTGTALNVTSTIGGSGLNFQSISSNGAPNGIVLSNTTGTLTVAGNGGSCTSAADCTGGAIQASTSDGISLTSVPNVSLTRMFIGGSGRHGINTSSINGLTLANSVVKDSGNADNEYGLHLVGATGTVAITSTTFDNAGDNLVFLNNNGPSATLNVTGSAFSYPAVVSGTANAALLIQMGGAAAITASITGNTFTNIVSKSTQFGANEAGSNGTQNLTFSNNTITVNLAARGSGLEIDGQESTKTNITVDNNTFTGAGGNGVITIDTNDSSTVQGTVTNNTITNPPGIGMFIAVDEAGTNRIVVDNNTITNAGSDGIQTVNFGVGAAGLSSNMQLAITNNAINGHSTSGTSGIPFVGGISATNFSEIPDNPLDRFCLVLRGNTVTGTPASPTQCGGAPCVDYYLEEVGGTMTLEEVPNTGNLTANAAYVNSINDAGPVTIFGIIDLTNGGLCATAPVP